MSAQAVDRSGAGTGGRLDPALVYFKDAIYATQAGRRSEAIADYVAGLQLRPDFMAGHFNLGQLYLQTGRRDAAINEFVTVAENSATSGSLRAAAQLRLGLLYEHAGNLDWAIQEFTAVVRQEPHNPDALGELGSIAVRLNEIDNAITFYESYERVVPGNVQAHYNLGVLYARKNRFADALREFEFSSSVPNGLPRAQRITALLNCGVLYDRMPGHTADAAAAYSHVIRLDQQNTDAWLARGIDEQKLQNPAEAIRSYRMVLSLDPRSIAAQFNLGVLLLQSKQYSEAARAFAAVLALDPKNSAAHSDLALAYVMMADPHGQKGRQDQAMAHYQTALAADPKNPANYAGLAYLYELKGSDKDLKAAAGLYETLKGLRPGQPEILARLASVYARLKLWDRAISTAADASRLQPQAPEGWLAVASYQVEADRPKDAAATLRSFLKTAPANTEAQLRLASLLATEKPQPEIDKAVKIYQQVQQQHPDNLEALQALGSLLRNTHPQDAARYLQLAFDRAAQPEEWLGLGMQLSGLYESLNRPDDITHTYQVMIKRASAPSSGLKDDRVKMYLGFLRSALAHRYLAPPHPDYAAAAKLDEEIYQSNPADPQPLLDAAQAYELGGHPDDSRAAFERVLAKQPANAAALTGFLRLTMENGPFERSRDTFLQFLQRHLGAPESEAVFRGFATAATPYTQPQWLSTHPGVAADWIEKLFGAVEAAHPGDTSASSALANVYTSRGRWQDALEVYTRLAQQHPTRADFLASKALVEDRLQKTDAALADYTAAAQIDRGSVNYVAAKATLEEKLQQYEAALADWKTAVKLDGANPSYSESLLRNLERAPSTHDAEIKALESFLAEAPGSPILTSQLARLYGGPEGNPLRVKLYTRLLENPKLLPTSVQVLYRDFLAQSLEATGDSAGAIIQYRAAQKLNPQDALSQIGIHRLDPSFKPASSNVPTVTTTSVLTPPHP